MGSLKNSYLRHTLATIAYRFQGSLHGATEDFATFNPGHGARTTVEIIHHINQLLNASSVKIKGGKARSNLSEKLNLQAEIDRFNKQLSVLDTTLIDENLTEASSNRLLQGPLSDILTHIGQLSLMRRLNGNPPDKSGFSNAPITVGQLSYFSIL